MSNDGLEALAALASATPASGNTQNLSNLQSGGEQLINHTNCNSRDDGSTGTIGLSAQQLEQLIATATSSSTTSTGDANLYGLSPSNLALLQRLHNQRAQQNDSATFLAMQQLAYYQYLAQAQNLQQGLSSTSTLVSMTNSGVHDTAKAVSLALGSGQPATAQSQVDMSSNSRQVIPTSATKLPPVTKATSPLIAGKSKMLPPPSTPVCDGGSLPSQATPSATSSSSLRSDLDNHKTKTLTQPSGCAAGSISSGSAPLAPHPVVLRDDDNDFVGYEDADTAGKKLQKRAANRKSAQLSRKRKKQFMEELKEENDDLRRKEQILKSIPDLVIVFDSSGKLWFVSKSVSRILQYEAEELEGTSIWDRMCEDSVRLLKAAFMDSLAARQPNSDTAPLGSGSWELRLIDKDGSQKIAALNGVVHFAGERPECVCSIRAKNSSASSPSAKNLSLVPRSIGDDINEQSIVRGKSLQSVVNNDSASERKLYKGTNMNKARESFRVSDSGNSSAESESVSGNGSSDEMNGASSSFHT